MTQTMSQEEWQATQAVVKRMQAKYWFHVDNGIVYILHGGYTVAKAPLEDVLRISQLPSDQAWLNMTLPEVITS